MQGFKLVLQIFELLGENGNLILRGSHPPLQRCRLSPGRESQIDQKGRAKQKPNRQPPVSHAFY